VGVYAPPTVTGQLSLCVFVHHLRREYFNIPQNGGRRWPFKETTNVCAVQGR
jgi:hypothetical protein